MPKKYEEIRDKAKAGGLSDMMAKQKAAKIFNAQRPEGTPPVTRSSDKAPPAKPAPSKKPFAP